MDGWVKIHRKMLDNPVVFKDADHLAVWIYLLLNATHKEYPAMFKGQKIMLQPGQLITGRLVISKATKINESKIKRIINLFKSDQQIDQQTSNKNSLITVLNWDKYQMIDQQIDQPVTSYRPASDQQVTTNKNVKNKRMKEIKEKEVADPVVRFPGNESLENAFNDFVKHRKEIKKPMTDRAIALMVTKINKYTPEAALRAIETSIENGWQGIFPDDKDLRKEKINEQSGSRVATDDSLYAKAQRGELDIKFDGFGDMQ